MERLGVVSALLTAVCVVPYLVDVVRGRTRPQRTSWLVFATLSVVAAVSQLINGDLAGAWLSAGSAGGFGVVFIASIRRGVGGWERADRMSLAVASIGVAVSVITREPTIAVAAVIAAELPAVSLTVRKARCDPGSETLATWVIDGVAGVTALGAVTSPTVAALMYPLHHTCVNGWVATTILRARTRHAASPSDVDAIRLGRQPSTVESTVAT